MGEFNLSEKFKPILRWDVGGYLEADIKEFIKRLIDLSYVNGDGREVINVSDLNSLKGNF